MTDTNTAATIAALKRDKREMRVTATDFATKMYANGDGMKLVETKDIVDFISFANDIYKFIANGTLKKETKND